MKKSRYKEEQIIAVLKEVDAGAKLQDVIRRVGVSEQTYYRWKAKYGGMEASDEVTIAPRRAVGVYGRVRRVTARRRE